MKLEDIDKFPIRGEINMLEVYARAQVIALEENDLEEVEKIEVRIQSLINKRK